MPYLVMSVLEGSYTVNSSDSLPGEAPDLSEVELCPHPDEQVSASLEDYGSCVDTESNCSLEDAAAKVEIALRKNLKLEDCNGHQTKSQEVKGLFSFYFSVFLALSVYS